MMNHAKKLLLGLLLLAGGAAVAAESPRSAPVPGGIALVPISATTGAAPQAFYKGKRVWVTSVEGQWQAVVGIPLSARPGRHTLQLKQGATTSEAHFSVNAKDYPEQRLTLKNKRMVNPYAKDLERIRSELKRSKELYGAWRDEGNVAGRFQLPVEGRLSSPFGLKRFFNDEPRSPHSGIDIAAPTGTPVRAPASGLVVEVGEYFFNGKTVFVDHGQGLVSMYCHLDSIDVQPGQQLEPGESFATVGMTGRVTGPHLHWSVSLNGVRVDPILFMPLEVVSALNAAE